MTVHPGAFCSPAGATGISKADTPMICSVTKPGERARWRRNGPSPARPSRARGATRSRANAPGGATLPSVDAGIDPHKVPTPVDDAGIRAAIEEAYGKALAEKNPDPEYGNKYVMLKDVRKHLDPDLSKADVDRVLDQMITDPDVRLKGELNQAALDDDDRAAAVRIGGEDRDVMAIGDPYDIKPVKPTALPPMSTEPIKPPNVTWDRDQGLVHMNSAIGQLWQGLGDDRNREVDGHALGNVVADLGAGITNRVHSTNHAIGELKRIRAGFPDDSRPARVLDEALGRLHAPARALPELPANVPPQLRQLMADLNDIPVVRRGYDLGARVDDPIHETDVLADIAQRWSAGQLSPIRLEKEVRKIGLIRHESVDGHEEIKGVLLGALKDVQVWGRRPS